jgi:putative oxidoreductase
MAPLPTHSTENAMLDSTLASIRSMRDRTGAADTGLVLGRALVAALFIVSGIHKATDFTSMAGWMAGEGLPLAPLALAATIALEVAGGLALAWGIAVRATAWVLAGFVVAATLVFHAFWSVPTEQFADQLTHFLKNAAIVGALLLAAGPARRAA